MTLPEAVKAMGNGKIYQTSDPRNVYTRRGNSNQILCRVLPNGELMTRSMLIEEIIADNWEVTP